MKKIEQLIKKGVVIHRPESVHIGDDIVVNKISGENVVIYPGSKISGKDTLICKGTQIGYEGPATVVDCYVGPHVALKGGFFQESVFLEQSGCGLGAHIRRGTIFEEEASIAHTVGLKQTILFPYVTLGSLINFCDCLMAGGTSRQNHSEVGSSYVHFNYTPSQDKATPSLMGDVPNGVMLNQSPIFLGGQGGLVGPCRLAFGTVVAAGTICRKDQLKENYLVMESGPKTAKIPFKPGGYRNLKRILDHNFYYIANLIALYHWYRYVRYQFVGTDFPESLADGLIATLNKGVDERLKQLEKLKDKVQNDDLSSNSLPHCFCTKWSELKDVFLDMDNANLDSELYLPFCEVIAQQINMYGKKYLKVITNLNDQQKKMGTNWLRAIVDQVTAKISSTMNEE